MNRFSRTSTRALSLFWRVPFFFLLLFFVGSSAADPVRWEVSDGGNGHWYDLIFASANWFEARDAAEAYTFRGAQGHLATITSAEEHAFLVNTFLTGHSGKGFWLGGYQRLGQSATDEGWQWVTGETWDYTNWWLGNVVPEPNDWPGMGVEDDEENYLGFSHESFGQWNDANVAEPAMRFGYFVEVALEVRIRSLTLSALQVGAESSQQIEAINGVLPYTWSVVDGTLPEGMVLSTDGVFSGTPTELGESTFTVQVTDAEGEVAERTYTVEVVLVLPPPEIRTSKTSTTPVPGRTMDTFIVVENLGDTTATDLLTIDTLHDSLSLQSTTPEAVEVLPGTIAWHTQALEPNQASILSHVTNVEPSAASGTDIAMPVCTKEDWSDITECVENVDAEGCTTACLICQSNCILTCMLNPAAVQCFACNITCGPACGILCLRSFAQDLANCFRNKPGCKIPLELLIRIPVDPNEKLVVANSRRLEDGSILAYVQPDQTLVYPIHFENIGDVEALDVFVTDVLDANLDDSTLELLSPDGASYDSANRTVSWELLDRNLQPGETDNVLLSIKPVPGLPSGTEIPNVAEIQFEIFDPLVTPEVVNIIDTDKPNCVVDDLPPVTSTEEFAVSWTGTDAVGEIEAYAVFVSTDGAGWGPFLAETQETSAQFTGEDGGTYEFLCAARDTAGNTEEDSLVPEATTTIAVVTNEPPVSDPNGPYTGTAGVAVAFDGSGSSDADGTIVTYDWDFGDGGTGTGVAPSHTYAVAGVYTVTLTVTDDAAATDTATTTATIAEIVNQPPHADPNGPYTGTEGEPVSFDGSASSDPDGTIMSYDWEFGDGNTGTGVAPSHTYGADGVFTVTLTVTDDGELTDTATTTATIAVISDDDDGDGVTNNDDECPETPSGEGVDQMGCSAMQFCSQIELGGFRHPSRRQCRRADWKDNETRTFPLDCRIDRNRTPFKPQDDTCVSTQRAN